MRKASQKLGAEGARPLRNASPEASVRAPGPAVPGIHRVHKPVGATSHACLRGFLGLADGTARGELPACHGGTLDPFAEGLLLVLVGGATRVMERLHALPKVYEAEVAWGTETDTGDAGGVAVAHADAVPRRDEVERALAGFLGWTDQVPPATSARRVDGERAYVRVHRGEVVVLPPTRVYLHDAAVVGWNDAARRATIRLTCRGGYYVRALARDLGRAVGCPVHLVGLRRTAIGPWTDPGGAPGAAGGWKGPLLRHENPAVGGRRCGGGPPPPPQESGVPARGVDLLPWLPSRVLTASEHARVVQGGTIVMGTLVPPRWSPPDGFPAPAAGVIGRVGERAVAVLVADAGLLRMETALRGGV